MPDMFPVWTAPAPLPRAMRLKNQLIAAEGLAAYAAWVMDQHVTTVAEAIAAMEDRLAELEPWRKNDETKK